MLHGGEEIDKGGGDRIDLPGHLRDHGPQIRTPIPPGFIHRITGQVLETGVFVTQADNRSDGDGTVHDVGHLRQQFADLYTRQTRADRIEFATNFRRSFCLQVKRVLMGNSPGKVDHDHRLIGRSPRSLFGLQQLRQGQAPDSQTTDLQK